MIREPLSKREIEVMYFLARGFQNKQIAQKLFVSTKTIEKHRQSIYFKWNIRSEIALARVALRSGAVTLWDFISSPEGENVRHAVPANQVRIMNKVRKNPHGNNNRIPTVLAARA